MRRYLPAIAIMPILVLSVIPHAHPRTGAAFQGARAKVVYLPMVRSACGSLRATTRVSVASDGTQGDKDSVQVSISADGRFVAFTSYAGNLVAGDTNGEGDVFVHDRHTGQTTRVSVASDGTQGKGEAGFPSISADGRFVSFYSYADNLVTSDTNFAPDLFVHDLRTRSTTRVFVAPNGASSPHNSLAPSISADGRFVAFTSESTNLVVDDTNATYDVFVHDLRSRSTTRVSVASNGIEGDAPSAQPSISADGRFVAFTSESTNLVSDDRNVVNDVFVHDRETAQTTRVSVASNGKPGNVESQSPSISADGRFVAFHSYATNLVAGDTNVLRDVFIHDRQTGQTTRVSVASDGSQSKGHNGHSEAPSVSADGRFVAFHSFATNLVADDTNVLRDVFIRDQQTGQTTRVSVTSDGTQGKGTSQYASISADGRFVAFYSYADNLVANDTNEVNDVFVHETTGREIDGPRSLALEVTSSWTSGGR